MHLYLTILVLVNFCIGMLITFCDVIASGPLRLNIIVLLL